MMDANNQKGIENQMNPTVLNIEKAALLQEITPLAREINCLDIEKIAKVCVERVTKLVNVRFISLYVLDETNNMLYLQKYNHPYLLNKIVSLNQNPSSPMIMAIKSKETVVISDIDTHQRPIIRKSQRMFANNYKTKNCVIVPLMCQENVVGIMNFADKVGSDNFNNEDVALIELIGQLIGASIGNIKLFEKIQGQARKDGLTGLINYRTFYEILEKELRRSRRYGGQVSLVMIDVDNLKRINDTYGHRIGDKAILEISRRIKGCIRQIDSAARYGGDEFAVILPNTSLEEAVVVAERMVNAVANAPITGKKEEIINLTISIGLGQYDAGNSPEDITSCSDRALYLAKQAGKNTVKVFNTTA